MTYIRTSLAATTALCLSMGMAYAGGGNTLYLDQDGTGNTSKILQNTGVGGNNFGTSGDHALQRGDGNSMTYTNDFSGNTSAGDNDVKDADQIGDNNTMVFTDSGGSYGNRVNNVIQKEDNNYAQVRRNAADGGLVDLVLQDGDNNYLAIYQRAGDYNSVGTVRQIGSNNGGSPNGYDKLGMYIYQHQGSHNRVDEASIIGSGNKGASGGLSGNVQRALYIEQNGSYNGRTSSTAKMYGTNNDINVVQTGDWNNFRVIQGSASVAGADNVADLAQTGSYNDATLIQNGTGNYVTAVQFDNKNKITASFTGNDNGVGTMDGVAGALLADPNSPTELFQGNIFQDSTLAASGNSITYTVTGSSNLFAFAQIGGGNKITGTVGTSSNQVAVLQTGSGNGTAFTQNGGANNNLAVKQ